MTKYIRFITLAPGGDGQSSWLGSRRGKDLLNLLVVNQLWDISNGTTAENRLYYFDCIVCLFHVFPYFVWYKRKIGTCIPVASYSCPFELVTSPLHWLPKTFEEGSLSKPCFLSRGLRLSSGMPTSTRPSTTSRTPSSRWRTNWESRKMKARLKSKSR